MYLDGILNTTQVVQEITKFDLPSYTTSKQYKLNAQVTPPILINLPTNKIDLSEWKHINILPLANPTFYKPGKTDLLIGTELLFRAQATKNKVGLHSRTLNWDGLLLGILKCHLREPQVKLPPSTLQQFYLP